MQDGTSGVRGAGAAAKTDTCAGDNGQPLATGLPPLPCLPIIGTTINRWADDGANITPTTQKVRKAKVTLQLPPIKVRAFEVICPLPKPPSFSACPAKIKFPRLDTSVSPDGYLGVAATVWFKSPSRTQPEFGVLPTLTVKMLAFGSIPVTAHVHITQPLQGGVAQPLSLTWLTSNTFIVPGKRVPGYEQYGPAPKTYPDGSNPFFSPPARLAGPVVIRIDDVRVDGVSLPVGPSCQTATTLNLGAKGGFYDSNLAPRRGQPVAYRPLYSGVSYLNGKVDIPSFTGCHNGPENLDPLLTGMVSGPGNPIYSTQVGALQPFKCIARPANPGCSTNGVASLTPAQRRSIDRELATGRVQFKSLPPYARAAVRRSIGRAGS